MRLFCRYKTRSSIPVIVSVFDTGNGKALVCPRCKGIDYEVTMDRRIAKLIKLEDADNHNADVSQDVVVYDQDVEDLTPGELVQVEGEMFVERKPGSGRGYLKWTMSYTQVLSNTLRKKK